MKTEDYMLPCLNKKLFGIDCPGCGTQRAMNHLIHGEFLEAFNMFPAIYSLILFITVVIVHFLFNKKIPSKIIIGLALLNITIITISYIIKIKTTFN